MPSQSHNSSFYSSSLPSSLPSSLLSTLHRSTLLGACSTCVRRLALAVIALLCATAVNADDWLDNPPATSDSTGISGQTSSFVAQPNVSAAQAAARVRRIHGGRVLSVSPSRRGDALGYRVRVLIDGGRVKTVYVNSGQSTAPNTEGRRDRPQVRTIGDG